MPVIWLIEDNALFRRATERALQSMDQTLVIRAFESCEAALTNVGKEEDPQVILLDVGLPGMSGIEGIQWLKRQLPEVNILIFTVFEDDEKIFSAICAGACGYLLKSEPLANVTAAIALAMDGGAPMNPGVARRVMARFSKIAPTNKDYGLSEREHEVLELMVQGSVKRQIAEKLLLNSHTVDYTMRCIYRKLHVNCQAAAVLLAVKDGVLKSR